MSDSDTGACYGNAQDEQTRPYHRTKDEGKVQDGAFGADGADGAVFDCETAKIESVDDASNRSHAYNRAEYLL